MKRLLLTITLLGLGGLAQAQQQVCISFDSFCDGISYTPGAGFLWEGYDCAGADSAISAVLPQGNGQIRLVCQAGTCDVPGFYGYDIAILDLDIPGRLMQIIGIDNGAVLFSNSSSITLSQGACPFRPDVEGGSALAAP